jgi:hypothetical protein
MVIFDICGVEYNDFLNMLSVIVFFFFFKKKGGEREGRDLFMRPAHYNQ